MKTALNLFVTFTFLILHVGVICSESISDHMDSICRVNDVNGLIAIVVQDTSIKYQYTFGSATFLDNGKTVYENLSEKDLWRIASVSKNIIATAIMILNDRKQLEIDSDINDYLPYKVVNPTYPDVSITLRMLLSHQSSIMEEQYVYDSYNGITFSQIKPGTKYEYSNINYLLLATIIESITGERFDVFIHDNLFVPLGIDGYFSLYQCDKDRLIYGKWYDKKNDRLSVCDTYKWIRNTCFDNYTIAESTKMLDPAGGCIISPADLAKYVMMHANNGLFCNKRILSIESENSMRQGNSIYPVYALGTIDYSYLIKGKTLYGHTGYSLGIFSCIIYNPIDKYGVVILCDGAKIDYPKAFDILHGPLIKSLYSSKIIY